MIVFRHNATALNNVYLECSGHAGFASKGNDIICAAASILMEATAEALKRSNAPRLDVTVATDVPRYAIRCKLTEETAAVVRTAVCGFEMMAKEAPEYVTCERVHKPE